VPERSRKRLVGQRGESIASAHQLEKGAHGDSEITREDQQDTIAQQRNTTHQLIEQEAAMSARCLISISTIDGGTREKQKSVNLTLTWTHFGV